MSLQIHCSKHARELIAKRCVNSRVRFQITDKGISIPEPTESVIGYARGILQVENKRRQS